MTMIVRRAALRLGAATLASVGLPTWAKTNGGNDLLAGLLLPVTSKADLSRSLHHAADLAQLPAVSGSRTTVLAFDTGSSLEGAASAAATAVKRGVPILIGPLYGPQVIATVAAAAGVPVLALTNSAVGSGAFLLGITPQQAVGAVLEYARSRGVRRFAIDAGTSPWDRAAAVAAQLIGRKLGMTVTSDSVDAVLVTGDADALIAAVRRLEGSGCQLLATHQALALSGAGLAAIDGAWLAAPDPDRFSEFASRFEQIFGNSPGLLAGSVYDAVGIARAVRAAGNRDGAAVRDLLTGSAGFPGVNGTVYFRDDGSAVRELAILVAADGTLRAVARSQPV